MCCGIKVFMVFVHFSKWVQNRSAKVYAEVYIKREWREGNLVLWWTLKTKAKRIIRLITIYAKRNSHRQAIRISGCLCRDLNFLGHKVYSLLWDPSISVPSFLP